MGEDLDSPTLEHENQRLIKEAEVQQEAFQELQRAYNKLWRLKGEALAERNKAMVAALLASIMALLAIGAKLTG